MELRYRPPGPVAKAFLKDKSFFRGIQGPVGSGKSSACCMAIAKAAAEMPADDTGLRRSRWAVIRNTYPELKTTTIKTWQEWFPEESFGRFYWTPPFTHEMRFADVELEVMFLALDRDEDIGKLLSLDLTGAWINEAREIPKAILDATTMRLGRFPPRRGVGEFWYGVIADTNAPPEDHWFAIMSGQAPAPESLNEAEQAMLITPDDWKFYLQPGGLIEKRDEFGRTEGFIDNPEAENTEHLPPDYYQRIATGKSPDYVRVYGCNKIGSARSGKPVYPDWRTEIHVASSDLTPDPLLPILLGLDFGFSPAAMFAQRYSNGRIVLFDELIGNDIGATRFAEKIKARLNRWESLAGAAFEYEAWGDPAGDARSSADERERTTFQILAANGVFAKPTHSNDPILRIEAVTYLLTNLVDGMPMLTVSPRCKVFIRGAEEGYHYKQKKGGFLEDNTSAKPEKNHYSHPHDAVQYIALGVGIGKELKRRQRQFTQPQTVRQHFNPYDRLTGWNRDRAPRIRTR